MEKEAFNLGKVIAGSWAVYFTKFHWIFLFSVIPTSFVLISDVVIESYIDTPNVSEMLINTPFFDYSDPSNIYIYYWIIEVAKILTKVLVEIFFYSFSTICLTFLVFDAVSGKHIRPAYYIAQIPRMFIPVFIVYTLTTFAIFLGIIFIIPGILFSIWFFIALPAVVLEDAGFSAPRRSKNLVKRYGWQILGLIVVFGFVAFVSMISIDFINTTLTTVSYIVTDFISLFIPYTIFTITGTVTYHRLVEIKQGYSDQNVSEIFS